MQVTGYLGSMPRDKLRRDVNETAFEVVREPRARGRGQKVLAKGSLIPRP